MHQHMTRLVLALAFVVGLASVAQAQHPCDVTPAGSSVGVTNNGIAFCHPLIDTAGNSTVLTSFRITIDAVQVFNGPLTQMGGLSPTGSGYFETPKNITMAKGTHTVAVFASNADGESVSSDPLTWQIKGVPPGKPLPKAIVR